MPKTAKCLTYPTQHISAWLQCLTIEASEPTKHHQYGKDRKKAMRQRQGNKLLTHIRHDQLKFEHGHPSIATTNGHADGSSWSVLWSIHLRYGGACSNTPARVKKQRSPIKGNACWQRLVSYSASPIQPKDRARQGNDGNTFEVKHAILSTVCIKIQRCSCYAYCLKPERKTNKLKTERIGAWVQQLVIKARRSDTLPIMAVG